MNTHPIQLSVVPPSRTARIHVLTRLALLVALGAVGVSSVYWLLYLLLPTLAAMAILNKGGQRYLDEDGPRVVRALRWLASAYGYLWLLTDFLPTADGNPIDLRVELGGQPTAKRALLRWLLSLPALAVLAVLSFAAGLMWIVGAVSILAVERMPAPVADFLAVTLRLQFRLIAYHLSLTDRYPSLESPGLAMAHG